MASFVFRRLIWKYIGKSYLPLTKNRIIIMHFIVKMTYFFGFLIHVNSVFRIISKSSIISPPNVYFNLPLLWLQMCFILPHMSGQDETFSLWREKSFYLWENVRGYPRYFVSLLLNKFSNSMENFIPIWRMRGRLWATKQQSVSSCPTLPYVFKVTR